MGGQPSPKVIRVRLALLKGRRRCPPLVVVTDMRRGQEGEGTGEGERRGQGGAERKRIVLPGGRSLPLRRLMQMHTHPPLLLPSIDLLAVSVSQLLSSLTVSCGVLHRTTGRQGRMPPRKKARKNGCVGARSHISNLPDGVLQHMLSFLPAQDAVRTCVLAKSWRHLWRFATGLRFVCGGTKEPESMEKIQALADHPPLLQRMPSLLTAFVEIQSYEPVSYSDDGSKQSILVQGLSEVRNLVLMSPDTKMFLFRRDLKFCSSFNKLKHLTLDECWCEPADFSSLACLLKLCPVLEKLTLQLDLWG